MRLSFSVNDRGTGSDSRAITAALSLEDVGVAAGRARPNDGAGEHPGIAL